MCQEGIQPTKNKGLAERGIRTPGTSFSSYNGLANSSFHSLVFGINSLCSGELPYFGAKSPCLGPIVQLLCNRKLQRFRLCRCFRTPTGLIRPGVDLSTQEVS